MLTTSTHVHYYLLSSVSITYFVFSEASVLNKTERIYLRKERDVCQLSRERGERGEERGERGEGEGRAVLTHQWRCWCVYNCVSVQLMQSAQKTYPWKQA